jgi:hypothetical protein
MCGDTMANMTLSMPDDIHREMRRAEKLASKSRLTQKDADEFSRKIKRLAAKRF